MSSSEQVVVLEQINRLIERRQSVTSTYLSVNTAIIGALAFLFSNGTLSGFQQRLSVIILLLSGVVVCDLWRRLIVQHTTLLGWWYEELRKHEQAAPPERRLFTREYETLYIGKEARSRIGMTRHEIALTQVFMAVNLLFAIGIVVAMFTTP